MKQTIKMVAFNPMTRKMEEVYPEDEIAIDEMIPMIGNWAGGDWVTVPGATARDFYTEWIGQIGNH